MKSSMAQIKFQVQSTGDLGIVAEQSTYDVSTSHPDCAFCVQSSERDRLNVRHLGYEQESRQNIVVVCRLSLLGKLRNGLAEQSLLQALALACTKTFPNQKMYPPKILHTARKLGDSAFKAQVNENALILKTTYWQAGNENESTTTPTNPTNGFTLFKCGKSNSPNFH